MIIYNFFQYIKYFYYFHKLILTLLVYITYFKIYNTHSPYLLKILNIDIQNSGCIIIKFIQWLYTRYNTINQNNNQYNLLSNFNNVFENCKLHDYKHTENLFNNELLNDINDVVILDSSFKIRSGSIAQIYKGTLKNTKQEVAIKVTHPNLYHQMIFPYLYFLIYNKLTINIPFLKKYRIPFEMCNFFENFYKQIDMNNEAKNLKYFYKQNKSNKLIVIPKPIIWSKNILIMKYIDGEDFLNIQASDYIKHKIILILNLFIKNSLTLSKYYHADLHNSNWKVILDNKDPKIVIYDFGFCIETTSHDRKLQQYMHKALELNNHELMAKCVYNYLSNNPKNIDEQTFINFTINFMKDNKYNLYNNQTLKYVLGHYIKNDFILKSELLDMVITLLLIDNHLKKYLYLSDVNIEIVELDENYKNNKTKLLYEQINNYLLFCKTNNCFYLLQKYLSNYIEEIAILINNNINIDLHNDIKKYKTIKNRTTHISIETDSIDI